MYYNQGNQIDEPYDFNDRFLEDFFGIPRRNTLKEPLQEGQASGFLVSKDGYLLTNAHVVQNAVEITITLHDGQELKGKVIGIDPNTDIAALKIEGKNFPYLALGNSDALDVGQWVVAIGNPLGLQASVTAGIVSAKGRNNLSLVRIEDFIQTDAAINRGNSGGPLLSLDSQVIGMNTAIVSDMGAGGYMGIGFAIPSNILAKVMQELIETGSVTRGFIGVALQQINHDLAQAFGLDRAEGVLVSEVTKGSPAEKGGLKQGDVILEYNSKKVDNIATFRNAVSLMKPGSNLPLTILRNGKKINFPVTIGVNPDDRKLSALRNGNALGIEVSPLNPEAAKKLGAHDTAGVVIKSVKAGSPASFAGLRTGALIVAVNNHEIHSPEEFMKRQSELEVAKPILLLVKQGNLTRFVSIKTD